MIMHGIPLEKILDSVRESSGRGRASILERVDLVNITKGFGLFGKSRLHSDDSTSVRLYVEKFKESSELLYFKDQDEMDLNHPAINKKEFILGFMTKNQELYLVNQLKKTSQLNICMDSTHCVCQYKGYQLTTLMCVNDQSQSFPVSFLISSTVSSDIIKVFLDSVKDRVGLIKAHTFMSDDDPIFRNAWHASMYEIPAAFYLNCSWHTDQTFRKNIAKIKATIGEKAVVYQMLRALMDELEEEKFEELCQGFLKYLLDAGYIEFHNYFQQNYLVESRVKLWPKCHRQNVNLTTNNYLESMHKVLKYIYLKGKKAKRLDCTIFALEKMVNDKLYSQMISLMRSRKIAKVKSNFIKCHQEGMDLEIIQQDHGRFMVESASIKDKQYEIQTNTICNNCKERCPDCNVCICMYCCTCEDNKRRNVCKHIHAVANFCKLAEFDTVEHDKASTSDLQMLQELNFSNKNCAPDESIQNQKSQINNLFSSFPEKLQNCNDPDTLQAIMMHMTQIDGLFTASSKYPLGTSSNSLPVDFDTIKEPANKNTVKQVALYSTQKKRKCEKSLLFKNASKEVRKEIRDSLMLEKGDVGSIPVISDGKVDSEHCYS